MISPWLIWIISVLEIFWFGNAVVWALQGFIGNEGICTKEVTKLRREPSRIWLSHQETYLARCGFLGLKTCTKVRTSGRWHTNKDATHIEMVVEEYCCPGYKDISSRCTPVCTSVCENGLCTGPELCTCLGGYLRNESETCEPVCTEPCKNNQHCAAPDHCICNDGFTLVNENCEPACSDSCINGYCSAPDICACLPGFKKDPDNSKKCDSICKVPCENGFCLTPNECSCHEGYKKNESNHNVCDPVCSKVCVNGVCSAPETCTCLTNYEKSTTEQNVCVKVCDKSCTNGYCTRGNVCICNDKYKKNEKNPDICDPICLEACQNGICTSPEVCTCLPNYTVSEINPYICNPICEFGCENGFCSSPGICSCKKGFTKIKPNENVCTPVCSQECLNGRCVAPEVCSCSDGYEKDPVNHYMCRPVCKTPCFNAACSAPDTCTCYDGYEKIMSDDFRCQPVCHQPCNNAQCSGPEMCSCLEGFVKSDNDPNTCIPFCSKGCENGNCSAPEVCSCFEGFEKHTEDPYRCVPICTENCVNSVCSAPDICTCLEGYHPNDQDNRSCHAVCEKECTHGTCNKPNQCLCDAGFATSQGDPFTCVPHCHKDCVNGNCTAPDFCECFPEHEKDENNYYICNSKCSEGCKNGICILPDTCICMDGFMFVDNPNVCEPVCSSCRNGKCIAPDTCICDDNYENPPGKNGTCVPVCKKACINGDCKEPNSCKCWDGYKQNREEWNVCDPYCSSGCIDGTCKAPNVCECHKGYKVDYKKHRCIANCSNECVNGVCIHPDQCSCLWGFESSETDLNTCYTSKNMVHDCFFEMNSYLRNDSKDCLNNNVKLKLTDINNCMFLKSLVLKYFINQTEPQDYQIAVTFDCSLKGFNDSENHPEFEMDCSAENFVDASTDAERQNPSNLRGQEHEDLDWGSDFIYMSSEEDELENKMLLKANEQKLAHTTPKAKTQDEYFHQDIPTAEQVQAKKPVVFATPLIAQPPPQQQSYKKLPPEMVQHLPKTQSIVKNPYEEISTTQINDGPLYVFPAFKRTVTTFLDNVRNWKKKTEETTDEFSDNFFQKEFGHGKITESVHKKDGKPKLEIEEKFLIQKPQVYNKKLSISKEKDVKLEHSQLDNPSPLSDLELKTSEKENLPKKVIKRQADDYSSEISSEQYRSGEETNIKDEQFEHRIVDIETEGNSVLLKLKINFTDLIKTEEITTTYFNVVSHDNIKENWCLCFMEEPLHLCLGDTHLKFKLCPCGEEVKEEKAPGFEADYFKAIFIIAIVLLVLFCVFILFKKYKSKGKVLAADNKATKKKEKLFVNNHIPLEINANCNPCDDENTTSSKL